MRTALKFFFTLMIFVAATSAHAQIFDKTAGPNLAKLLAKPLTIYAPASGALADRLQEAFKKYWTIGEYKFSTDGSAAANTPVLMPGVVSVYIRDHETGMNNPFWVFGAANASGIVDGSAIIAAFPINGFSYEWNLKEGYMYEGTMLRMPYIVYNLNDMLNYLKDDKKAKKYDDYVNEKSARLAKKTLIIPEDLITEWDMNPNVTAMMKNSIAAGQKTTRKAMGALLDEGNISFNGKYKVMKNADIIKLEESAEADKYALFLPAIDNKKYMMAFDLKTKELLYYETVNMGMRIKSKDFEKMNKAAGLN